MALTTQFGRWLLGELKKHGWSRADLSERIFVAPSTISAWVLGRAKPTDDKLEILIDLFQADRAKVFTLAGKGYAGVGDKLSPKAAEMAHTIEAILANIEDPAAREMAEQTLQGHLHTWADSIEQLVDYLETLKAGETKSTQ
jgi:transcriptional regulator with XRE-family HTH domain